MVSIASNELKTQNLSISEINHVLENPEITHNFIGKRTIVVKPSNTSSFSFKTDLDSLLKALADNLLSNSLKYSQHLDNLTSNPSAFKQTINIYKKNVEQSKDALKKLHDLDSCSKKVIKNSNIITRIFFYFISWFSSFSFNLKKALDYISEHEKIIAQREIQLESILENTTINKTQLIFVAIILSNFFLHGLSYLGISEIPYVTKSVNIASFFVFGKLIITSVIKNLAQYD